MTIGSTWRRLTRLVSALAVTAAVSVTATPPVSAQPTTPKQVWVEESARQGIDADAPLRFSSVSTLADELSQSVVNIIVSYGHRDKIERLLSGDGWTEEPTVMAQGSGFIIHPDGYILTNHHVVEGASAIKIKLVDDTEYNARVVGVDPQTDVALIKIEAGHKLPAIALGDSDATNVGEYVLAIGNPLGLSHTVTTGIVSALGRRDLGIDNDAYAEFIQTDASINPGNSGGPLIGLSGEVVGMNTAINRKGQGIGFAIPINMVKKILPDLANKGYVVRSWLGIRVQALDKKLAATFGLKSSGGALVTEVVDKSPAKKAGIQAGDVLLSFDGAKLASSDRLPWLASTAGPGRTVAVTVRRDNRTLDLVVTLEQLPDQQPPKIPDLAAADKSDAATPARFGLEVEELTNSLARKLGAADAKGVVVTKVGSDTPAGVRQRDVITEVGNSGVSNSDEFSKALSAVDHGDVVRLKVVRGGRVVYIAVEKK